MARPENPFNPADSPAAGFAYRLRQARQAAGSPPYRAMAARVHYSAPALSTAAAGRKLPTWEVTKAYLRACDITDPATVAEWRDRWSAARQATAHPPAVDEEGTPALALDLTAHRQALLTQARQRAPRLASGRPPVGISSLAEYVAALRQLRQDRRISIREIASRSRAGVTPLSRSNIGDVLQGKRRNLDVRFVHAYLAACELTAEEVHAWMQVYSTIEDTERRIAAAKAALATFREPSHLIAEAMVLGPAAAPVAPEWEVALAPPEPEPPSRYQGYHRSAGPPTAVLYILAAAVAALLLAVVLATLG